MGATQRGSGTCILGPGLVPVLTMLEGFGSVYGLWVKITVARSNRKWGCQEEGVEAWVVYRKTQSKLYAEMYHCCIKIFRGNCCQLLHRMQPFTFYVISEIHPLTCYLEFFIHQSTHRFSSRRQGRLFQTSLFTQQHPPWQYFSLWTQWHCQARWDTLDCPSSKYRCTAKIPSQSDMPRRPRTWPYWRHLPHAQSTWVGSFLH